MTWIERVKNTRPISRKASPFRTNKREVVLENFLLRWLTETVSYNSRFRYEKVRTKMNPLWNDSSKRGFSNDWMLSRLVDHLEMKHYGQHITREKNKEDA